MEPPKFTEVAEKLKLSLQQANIDKELLEEWDRLMKRCELIAGNSEASKEEIWKATKKLAAETGITTVAAMSEVERRFTRTWGWNPLKETERKKNYEKCGCMLSKGQMVVYVTPNCPNGHLIRGQLATMIKNCKKCRYGKLGSNKEKGKYKNGTQ